MWVREDGLVSMGGQYIFHRTIFTLPLNTLLRLLKFLPSSFLPPTAPIPRYKVGNFSVVYMKRHVTLFVLLSVDSPSLFSINVHQVEFPPKLGQT
ncbi:hypothetical protein TNIN_97071 [Trichonephila inaurata madagascariensis]|uniref:Uncharacterized protein n=1 Tax=Trichonephila inaurata madagascariensis TaxID=2747483 RepID=A0A8X6XTW1_9ARAC|nr:hypothetical protein TNIN_97071 [Trichonephila inaurata madagascariensis]